MARALRIEYEGACYQVLDRGNGRRRVWVAPLALWVLAVGGGCARNRAAPPSRLPHAGALRSSRVHRPGQPLPLWRLEGRIVSDMPLGFTQTVLSVADNPCFFAESSSAFRLFRREIRSRDHHLLALHAAMADRGDYATVEAVVFDGLRISHGSNLDCDHLALFTCGSSAVYVKRSLERLGARYVTEARMRDIRPLVRAVVAPTEAMCNCQVDLEEVVVVAYFDGSKWYSRPWFYVTHETTKVKAGPYLALRRLLGLLWSALDIDFGSEGGWSFWMHVWETTAE